MIKILIVDDHQLVRAGFRRMLADIKGLEVVAEADSGEEAIGLVRRLQPDVVLMDVQMPGIGGVEATRRLLRYDPDLKIIVVTVYDEAPFPTQLLELGVVGYVTKDAEPAEMINAIRKAKIGQHYLSSDIAQQLALSSHRPEQQLSPFTALTGREIQIATMVVNCRKVQEISASLCLSPKTVNSYRYRIFEKLNISSDVELTRLAVRHGMIDVGRSETASA